VGALIIVSENMTKLKATPFEKIYAYMARLIYAITKG